jgi:hypothetical protein
LDNFPHVRIVHVRTSEHSHEYQEVYHPSRIGYLRNLGLAASDAELFCHLDDDNMAEIIQDQIRSRMFPLVSDLRQSGFV